MVQNVKVVGPNRYRESFGRSYEDFKVGDIYEHRPGRTISETARALDMKETAVRVAFHRGLTAIAQRFGRSS